MNKFPAEFVSESGKAFSPFYESKPEILRENMEILFLKDGCFAEAFI